MAHAHPRGQALIENTVICATCGVERSNDKLPAECPICADERQYLPADGVQRWADPQQDVAGEVVLREPGLWGINVAKVGIGQQAKVVTTPAGNVMVDVPPVITDDLVDRVRSLGNVVAIIPTHPHMFGCQSLWSEALGGVEVYVARADDGWLGRTPAHLRLIDGDITPVTGVTLTQPGGHFPGSVAVHWTGEDGAGVLLAGDTVMVNPDLASVSFMRSYPNRLPLSGNVALRIAEHLDRFQFDRLYNNFALRIDRDAKSVLAASARRHADWASGVHDDLT